MIFLRVARFYHRWLCACRSGNTCSMAAAEMTSFRFLKGKMLVFSLSIVKTITPGSCLVQQFYYEPLSCSIRAVLACAVLSGSVTAHQHAKCRHACSASPHHFLYLNSSSVLSNSWSIHSNVPIDKPSHLLTYPSLQSQTPSSPQASGGWGWEPSFGHSEHYTNTSPPQSSLVHGMKKLCHNTGIIPHSSGTAMRAVSPAYIIIPDICKFCVMHFSPPMS